MIHYEPHDAVGIDMCAGLSNTVQAQLPGAGTAVDHLPFNKPPKCFSCNLMAMDLAGFLNECASQKSTIDDRGRRIIGEN